MADQEAETQETPPTPEGANPDSPTGPEGDEKPFPVFSIVVHALSNGNIVLSGSATNAALAKGLLTAGIDVIDQQMAEQRLARANENAPRIAVPKPFIPSGLRGSLR